MAGGPWPRRLERRDARADRLVVEPPDERDAALRRDGVGATPARGLGVGAWLLEEIVAGTPLDTWTTGSRGPDGVSTSPAATTGRRRCCTGWAKAAVARGDAGWADALLTDDSRQNTTGAARGGPLGPAPGPAARRAGRLAADGAAPRGPSGHTGCSPCTRGLAGGAGRSRCSRRSPRRASTDRTAGSWRAVPGGRAGHAAALRATRRPARRCSSTRSPPTRPRVRPVADAGRAPSPSATR